MTCNSILKDIECLNKDIDNCKGKIGIQYNNNCPPNCYCDKRMLLSQKNYDTILRKKNASATVTKMDITPSSYTCHNHNNNTQRPKSAMSDLTCRKLKYQFNRCPLYSENHDKDYDNDDHLEPVKLSNKSSCVNKRPSWSTILQQNNNNNHHHTECYTKENLDCRKKEKKNVCTSSSSSITSTIQVEPVYQKNKRTQCDENSFTTKGTSNLNYDNHPIDVLQYLIYNMKNKLKDNPGVGSLLNEMESTLRKVPNDHGDNPNVGNVKPNGNSPTAITVDKLMNLEATYLELEATCTKLKQERDAAVQKASKKSVELIESMRREVESRTKLNDTTQQIKEMSKKLETYTKSMEGLTEHVKRLEKENKELEKIRGQITQLSNMMREVTMENKSLLTELQLVSIERNKLEVALTIKEQELEKKNQELRNVSIVLGTSKNNISPAELTKNYRNSLGIKSQDAQRNKCKTKIKYENRESPELVTSSPNNSYDSVNNNERGRKIGVGSPRTIPVEFDSWSALSTIDMNGEENNHNNNVDDNDTPLNNTLIDNLESGREQQQQTVHKYQQPDLSKVEKLKEEIRRMFNEMRELAKDIPSMPVVELDSLDKDDNSTDMNWSDVSCTINSCEIMSEDFRSSEYDSCTLLNKK